ncbi:MAG: SDR family oxidoreductase [Actinobacteria bacterium]|jgi:3alpha(or 20beta)-hydroxysteroid dehydrogenase|nr:SDR family oxidoreductase [Actinomycetota bacterium]
MLLEGKIAIVTGAARGTGAAICRRFIDEGATVVVTDVLVDEGHAMAQKLGPQASFAALDVTDTSAWESTIDGVLASHGQIDVLVNNAGILQIGSIANTSIETFRRVVDVNATGAFAGIAAVAPHMSARGSGSIINIASIDALHGMNGLSAYTASKWAMRGLTHAAALELGRSGIRVNSVCPAGGNPGMYGPWGTQLMKLGSGLTSYGSNRAIPREASPDEIARVALFLASELAEMVTGADIPVDGGHLAGDYIEGFDQLSADI